MLLLNLSRLDEVADMREQIPEELMEAVKRDLDGKTSREFYFDYFLCSVNWYFSKAMNLEQSEQHRLMGDLKLIISSEIPVSFNNIQIVGSSTIGYSLSPGKAFCVFDDTSDIDIAIISPDLFQELWSIFRRSYKRQYEATYCYIKNSLYRGYFNERDILNIPETRRFWEELSQSVKRRIRSEISIPHDIVFRIYRSWADLEEYQIWSIEKLAREMNLG